MTQAPPTTAPANPFIPIRPDWLALHSEEILEPDLPIVDPHHHLWERPGNRYLLPDLLADTGTGHRIEATVFVECRAMYRAHGPAELRSLGETEFVNGVAAMSASGLYGDTRACASIVGNVDLRIGARARDVLAAHVAVSGGRLRGIRNISAWHADGLHTSSYQPPPGLLLDPSFREGYAQLAPLGLSFDAWLLEPQLPEVIDLARAFPGTPIVLDHVGTPLGLASYKGKLPERFGVWRENIRELAKSENVCVKLGGLAMPFCNFPSMLSDPRAASTQLAQEWRPYIETCIEAFGPKRAMFESNFPVDELSCDYATLWNALKLIAKDATADDKHELFFGTANRFYQLGL